MTHSHRSTLFVVAAIALGLFAARPAQAQTAFNIYDSTPRFVTIYQDQEEDPTLIHADMVPELTGYYTVSGNRGNILITQAEIERYTDASGEATVVPHSFSDINIGVDLQTLDITDFKIAGDVVFNGASSPYHFETVLQTTPGPWTFLTGFQYSPVL